MSLERRYSQVEQSEPLIVRTDQEFFPFRNIKVEQPNGFLQYSAREFQLNNDGEIIRGRFFFQAPFAEGNVGIQNVLSLPFRFYTLADVEDDLVEHSTSYAGFPEKRVQFSVAFDLPLPLGSNRFNSTTRIKITNHLTGKAFWATEKKRRIGSDHTRSTIADHYSLIYDYFFYDDKTPNDTIDKPSWMINNALIMERGGREAVIKNYMDLAENPEELLRKKIAEEIADQMVTYWHPFHLTVLNKPQVMNQIGVNIINVPEGIIDLEDK